MTLVRLLTGLLRPPACLACGAPDAWPCCARCLPPEPAGPGPWRLAADEDLTLWALGPYCGPLRSAVLAGKLHAQRPPSPSWAAGWAPPWPAPGSAPTW
jgi:hypothetical protein